MTVTAGDDPFNALAWTASAARPNPRLTARNDLPQRCGAERSLHCRSPRRSRRLPLIAAYCVELQK